MAGKGGYEGPGGLGGPPWDKIWVERYNKYKVYRGCYPGHDGIRGHRGGLIGPLQALRGAPGAAAPDGKEAKDGQVSPERVVKGWQ